MNRFKVSGVYYVRGSIEDQRCLARLDRMLPHIDAGFVKEASFEDLDALVAGLGDNLGAPAHPYLFFGRFQRLTSDEESEMARRYPHLKGGLQRIWGAQHFYPWSSIDSVAAGSICTLRWSVNPCLGCYHACVYCGLGSSPYLCLTLNVEDLIERNREIMRLAPSQKNWHTGGNSDLFCFEPEYGYTEQLLNTAAREDRNVMFYTSSANVEFLLTLEHRDRAIIEWTISPEGLVRWERKTPSLCARLKAMQMCRDAGCTVRCQFAPFVPLMNWRDEYRDMLQKLFAAVEPDLVAMHMVRLYTLPVSQTLRTWFGEAGIDPEYMGMIEDAERNKGTASFPGNHFFPATGREKLYRFMVDEIRALSSDIPIVLCRETPEMWEVFRDELNVAAADCGCGTLPRARSADRLSRRENARSGSK